MYNAASCFLIKDDLLEIQLLRLSELMSFANEYLKLRYLRKTMHIRSDQAFTNVKNEKYQQPEYRNIAPFVAEIMGMSRIGAWCSLGAFYGLASVLGRPIQSIYPFVNSPLLREFTRIIEPRQKNTMLQLLFYGLWLKINLKNFYLLGKEIKIKVQLNQLIIN